MKKRRINIRETIKEMSRENLILILEAIYGEYPTIRHSFWLAFKEAIKQGENNGKEKTN